MLYQANRCMQVYERVALGVVGNAVGGGQDDGDRKMMQAQSEHGAAVGKRITAVSDDNAAVRRQIFLQEIADNPDPVLFLKVFAENVHQGDDLKGNVCFAIFRIRIRGYKM